MVLSSCLAKKEPKQGLAPEYAVIGEMDVDRVIWRSDGKSL